MLNASWLWNFGDGGTDSSQNPTHIFQSTGTYTVSLTATTAAGLCDHTHGCLMLSAQAINQSQTSQLMPTSSCASELRYFTNTSSGTVTSSFWSFGDGV
jgi:PKD repeat protein